jgi:hypothetical protein
MGQRTGKMIHLYCGCDRNIDRERQSTSLLERFENQVGKRGQPTVRKNRTVENASAGR